MSKSDDIQDELYSLLKQITDNIPKDKLPQNSTNIKNLDICKPIALITYIKELIPVLIEQKISEAKIQNNNNSNFSIEIENDSNLKKEYKQLENQLKKLESDNRYYIKLYLRGGIQKKISEMKLNAYMTMEEEYESLREKVKYDNGKFLDNERKDNEILILRTENSALKKEIAKFEINMKIKDNKIKEDQEAIQEMKENIDKMNNTIHNLQKNIETINNNNQNKLLIKEKNNSMIDLDFKNIKNENIFTRIDNFRKIHSKNNINIQDLRAVYPNTFKIRKTIKFNLLKNDTTPIENNKNTSKSNISINTTNTQLMASIFNKFTSNNKRNRNFPFTTIIKKKESKTKSLSMNKEGIKIKEDLNYKSSNKKRIFKNMLFSKQISFCPKSC